jgi:transposase
VKNGQPRILSTRRANRKTTESLKRGRKGKYQRNNLILLLLNDGKMLAKIADFFCFFVSKVSYWCDQVEPQNLESLRDERMRGNPTKATDKYIEILL